MFNGRRDPEVRIIVEKLYCTAYRAKTGGQWVEIFIPPENIDDYDTTQWGSIMIEPKQIDNLGKESPYNLFRVNDGAKIVNSVKDKHRNVVSDEILLPIQIIGRILKYERFKRFSTYAPFNTHDNMDIPSIALAYDMTNMGQSMLNYMNRMPIEISDIYTNLLPTVTMPDAAITPEEPTCE